MRKQPFLTFATGVRGCSELSSTAYHDEDPIRTTDSLTLVTCAGMREEGWRRRKRRKDGNRRNGEDRRKTNGEGRMNRDGARRMVGEWKVRREGE